MHSRIISVVAGAAALIALPAHAADYRLPRPVAIPVPVEDFASGWYLRGDVGVGLQTFDEFQHTQTNFGFVWPASWRIDQHSADGTAFLGAGIGYTFNSWFRVDFTGEYRMSAKFKAVGSYTEFCPGGRCFDVYDGSHSAAVFLANAYLDLGTWWCLTPFVGIGIGTAKHWTTSATDIGLIADGTTGFGYASTDASNWSFAWALYGGLSYSVSSSLKLELAYRYLDMGDAKTAIIDCASTGCATAGPRAYYTMTNFSSQDFKLGMRWMFDAGTPEPAYAPPPAYTPPPPAPPPVYAPPPPQVYAPPPPAQPLYSPQPPIMRKG